MHLFYSFSFSFLFPQDPSTLHLSWPFHFFVTFSSSINVHWIFPSHLYFHFVALLFILPEFWKWSGAPFPFCIVLLPHFLALWQSVYFFSALSAKSFCDCKYLSTIACASENTFGESTAAKFLLNACFAYRFLICRPIISFTNFIKSLSLLVIFLLNFRHGLSIGRSHVHLSIYERSFYQEFQQISKLCSFENSLRKVGHIGLSHGCHVIWHRSLIGCLS